MNDLAAVHQHVRRLRDQGWPLSAIADAAGCTEVVVRNWYDHIPTWDRGGNARRLLNVTGPPPPRRPYHRRPDDIQLDTSWLEHRACAGMDTAIFYPHRGGATAPAKKVCRGCPVAQACLDHALKTGELHGIWGGRSERERRRMRGGSVAPVALGVERDAA